MSQIEIQMLVLAIADILLAICVILLDRKIRKIKG